VIADDQRDQLGAFGVSPVDAAGGDRSPLAAQHAGAITFGVALRDRRGAVTQSLDAEALEGAGVLVGVGATPGSLVSLVPAPPAAAALGRVLPLRARRVEVD